MFFLPRRDLNFMDCELNRAIRYGGEKVMEAEYISFKLPRKGGSFNPDLFPPAPGLDFSMTFDQWKDGENKAPVLAEFDPQTVKKSDSPHRRASILRKKVLGEIQPEKITKFEVP